MIEESLTDVEESVDELRQRSSGVVTGRVLRVDDPLSLGRIQVEMHLACGDMTAWARIASPMAGMSHGMYFVPNIGDEVLVSFEHGDTRAPYIVGSLWTAMARPPVATPLSQTRAIRTLSGNQLVFQESPPSVTLQTAPTPPEALPTPASSAGPHHTISLSPQGIQLMTPTMVQIGVGTTRVDITPASTTVNVGSSRVVLSDAGVQITGTNIELVATGTVSIRGPLIRLNS